VPIHVGNPEIVTALLAHRAKIRRGESSHYRKATRIFVELKRYSGTRAPERAQHGKDSSMKYKHWIAAAALSLFLTSPALAQTSIVSMPVAEKKLTELPVGPLFWRIENFPTLAEAQAVSGPHGLAVEAFERVWLFTLGPQGPASPGGNKVADVGPLPPVTAPQYLLRVNQGSGVAGSTTTVHTHPGSEAYYVVVGEASQKSPHGVSRISAGQTLAGHGGDTAMTFTNSGTTDVRYFALFVVDATRPFASPAKFD